MASGSRVSMLAHLLAVGTVGWGEIRPVGGMASVAVSFKSSDS